MFLLSSLTNEDSYTVIHKLYNALRIQYSETVPGIPGFGTGSGTLEPVPWNRFLRQITIALSIFVIRYRTACSFGLRPSEPGYWLSSD